MYVLQGNLSVSVIGFANNHVDEGASGVVDTYDDVLPNNYQGPQAGQEVHLIVVLVSHVVLAIVHIVVR